MAEKRRLNLSFSMASPQQREAWRILRAIPAGRRTEAVCRAVCQADLVDTVRTVIREELQSIHFAKENDIGTQAGDVDEDVLGFLRSLQDGGEVPDSLF
ncbi:MAG: hypothetical protein HFE99_09390 [Ruminiclostridium sp.]|jgi:hypothetical protein|nr:hypothetical protein [Ruminiclostridium sp.]